MFRITYYHNKHFIRYQVVESYQLHFIWVIVLRRMRFVYVLYIVICNNLQYRSLIIYIK